MAGHNGPAPNYSSSQHKSMILALKLVTGILLVAQMVAADSSDSPNLIIALADDVSTNEFPWMNDGAPAPNRPTTRRLKAMAKSGVAFRTAWSMPICGPTRGSLVTGLYAAVTGWYDNEIKPIGEENSLGTKFGTFAQLAQSKGYRVLIAGKWQMVGEVRPYGYDEACLWRESDDESIPRRKLYQNFTGPTDFEGRQSRYWYPLIITNGTVIPTGPKDFGPNVIFDCVYNFIERQKANKQKFMVYMPLLLPHQGYDFDRNVVTWVPVPTVNKKGKILGKEPGPGSFKRNLEYQDYLMGKLLNFLKRQGLHRDTITFFMGDNGTHGNGKGSVVGERGTRIPFIVHGPGRVERRFMSDELVSTNDIYSTVRGLIGARRQGIKRQQSVDISPYLLGQTGEIKRKWLYAYRASKRLIRSNEYIYDGKQDLYFCPSRDERSCLLVYERTQKETNLVDRFRKILCYLEKNMTVDPNTLTQVGATCKSKMIP